MVAQSIEFASLSGVGNTPDEALKEAQDVVRAAVRFLKEDGEPVPEPVATREFKGKIAL
jgi:predicted RNase H-like HicB family nuclease